MKRLENKTAIVTGGNSGIGKATAILFAKEGADLVLCARRKEALDEVAEECRKYGVQVVTVKADVSSHEDCSAVVKAAVDTFGKVDILVNNAGIVDKHRPITECTDEWWNEIIAIDQSSLFYMMKDTIPHMMASGKGSPCLHGKTGRRFYRQHFFHRRCICQRRYCLQCSKSSRCGYDKERGYSAGTERYPLQRRLPGTNTDTAEYTGKSR